MPFNRLSIPTAILALTAWAPTGRGQAPTPPGTDDLSAAAAAFAASPQEPLISYRRDDAAASTSGPASALGQNSLRTQPAPPAPVQSPFSVPVPIDRQVQPAAGAEPVDSSLVETPAAIAAAPLEITLPQEAAAPRFDAAALAPPTEGADRRLAPPSPRMGRYDPDASSSRAAGFLPQAFGRFKSLSSAGAALAVVVALFLICISLVRRGSPKTSGMLPTEAFSVLGRSPLTAQSYAQLLRLGNKLVLVAVGADGAQTLAEVTDPLEVDRIAGLCAKAAPHGPSAEFQQVLAQLSREPAKGFLGREASTARRRG